MPMVRGRWLVVAWLAGTLAGHEVDRWGLAGPAAWGVGVLAVWATASLAWRRAPTRPARWMAALAAWFLVGCVGGGWTAWHVGQRQAQQLPAEDEDRISRVVLRVESLPRSGADGVRFQAVVEQSWPDGVPPRIEVFWPSRVWPGHGADARRAPVGLPAVLPGQRWRMALNVRSPRGRHNPWGFDYERHLFAQGVRAIGTVRGQPAALTEAPWASLAVVANRARHHVREALNQHVASLRYGPVLQALVIGDQAGVAAADWTVFNRSGITHLVSISGSHITMVAALVAWLVHVAWRRVRWRGQRLAQFVPARLAAAWAALLVAWLYCLLAGWGVPARRTFFMLAVVAACWGLRLPLGGIRVLALAALLVTVLDPWAVLSPGFWLSFAAVGILMAAAQAWLAEDRPARPGTRLLRALKAAVFAQGAISLGLLPVLAMWFHEISLVSPLANAYAIPVIGWLVTPLALLAAGLAVLPWGDGLAAWTSGLAHALLAGTMAPTGMLASLPAASIPVAAVPWPWVALAMGGIVYALLPHGLPARWGGWLLMLPALGWRPATPLPGDWTLVALDVGQAGAVVVRTHRHTLLFDTGMRRSAGNDDGLRTIVPFLRAWGVRRLDALVVSHDDLDHAGGLRSVLGHVPVGQVYASFDVPAWLARESRQLGLPAPVWPSGSLASACRRGQAWTVDGVTFRFLWPEAPHAVGNVRAGNARSCVLAVQGARQGALLTGDIGHAEERRLLTHGLPSFDLVMAPHHGSRYSSSANWTQALAPAHVVAQAGAWNRHGHPHPAAVRRWQQAGAQVWRTDRDGAIWVDADAAGGRVRPWRRASPVHSSADASVPLADTEEVE